MSENLLVSKSAHEIAISRAGSPLHLVVQKAIPDQRAYLHPLRSPCGRAELTEDRPPHHPWQHGLYIGLNDVNGCGFWCEGLNKGKEHLDGTFHPEPLAMPQTDGSRVNWAAQTQYRDPKGQPLLLETQAWRFTDHISFYTLDLTWTLRALTPVRFGKYAYGGLFLRMPYTNECAAEVLTSSGEREQAKAEGQRAQWVSVSMNVKGLETPAGIALMDHPANDGHPLPWRVDHQYGIGPGRCILGEWKLDEGQARTFLHRAVVFSGRSNSDFLREQFQSFSKQYN